VLLLEPIIRGFIRCTVAHSAHEVHGQKPAARWRIMDPVYGGTESCKLAITEEWMTAPCQPMAFSVAEGNGVIGRDV